MEDSELELVDALPYLDNEYENADMKREVDAMIAEEMKKFVPKKYLTDIPELFKVCIFWKVMFISGQFVFAGGICSGCKFTGSRNEN